MVTLTPLAMLVCIFFFFLLPMYYCDRRDMSDSEHYRLARKRTRRKFWKLVLFTVFLGYPGVSAICLSLFQCKKSTSTIHRVNVGHGLPRRRSTSRWLARWCWGILLTTRQKILYQFG